MKPNRQQITLASMSVSVSGIGDSTEYPTMNARRATPKRNTASIEVASPKEFEKTFSHVYQRFYNSNKISAEDE